MKKRFDFQWKTLLSVATLATAATAGSVGFLRADDELERALTERPRYSATSPSTNDAANNAANDAANNANDVVSNGGASVAAAPKVDDGSDIVVERAKVEIPKGEGSEALVSANGQGLLVELGLCEVDENGEAVLDEDGTTKRRPLTRGLQLKKGDVLGKQKDDDLIQEKIVAELELQVAKKEATKQIEVEVAEAAARMAQAAYKRADFLNKQMAGSISPQEVEEKYYDWVRAVKSIEKSKYDLEVNQEKVYVSEAKVKAAEVAIDNRRFVSPIDGIVDDVFQNEGQWLREGNQVLRVIRLDKVQVNGSIDAELYAPEMIDGKPVVVSVRRPGMEPQELPGKIVYVRQVVESNSYYFYADVENRKTADGYWLLNPGSLVTITIRRGAKTAASK